MSTTLEPQTDSQNRNQNENRNQNATEASERMRSTMAASRVSFTWFGTTKTLTDAQKATAAQSFGADHEVLSAGKKLLDTKHPAYKEVNSVKSRITSFWKGETLPFPQAGLRLIRQDGVEQFQQRMESFSNDLAQSVTALDQVYDQLKSAARDRLGDLYNSTDYPETMVGLFSVRWDFPNVEVPEYLRRLNPELYRQEAERVARRFDQALEMAETAFMEELSQLIEHLTERLTGEVDGKPKVFRDSAVTNLTSFFERFRKLNVRSNAELDELVASCQQVIKGTSPNLLRNSQLMRTEVGSNLREVSNQLDELLIDRPRRNLIRKGR